MRKAAESCPSACRNLTTSAAGRFSSEPIASVKGAITRSIIRSVASADSDSSPFAIRSTISFSLASSWPQESAAVSTTLKSKPKAFRIAGPRYRSVRWSIASPPRAAKLGRQCLRDVFGHHPLQARRIAAAKLIDLLHVRAGREHVLVAGQEEDGLDAADGLVDAGLLQLARQVVHVADAADQHAAPNPLHKVHGQAVIGLDLHVGKLAYVRPDVRDSFALREKRALIGILADPDDERVEEPRGAADDVQVAVRERVE